MAVWNLGSINADFTYRLPHLPGPGETLASISRTKGLGGKGANMSVALARAGAHVHHIGAVGPDGLWARDLLLEYGVDTREIRQTDTETAHAIIMLDEAAENQIVLFPGANHEILSTDIELALAKASSGDVFLTQNEPNNVPQAVQIANAMGLPVYYAAAPFVVEDVKQVLSYVDVLVLNEHEAAALSEALNVSIEALEGPQDVLVTKGSQGVTWHDLAHATSSDFFAYEADLVDTTGAGDTFTGYLIAGKQRGMPMAQAVDFAQRAAALMVSRQGTADVIPDLKEIQDAIFKVKS